MMAARGTQIAQRKGGFVTDIPRAISLPVQLQNTEMSQWLFSTPYKSRQVTTYRPTQHEHLGIVQHYGTYMEGTKGRDIGGLSRNKHRKTER